MILNFSIFSNFEFFQINENEHDACQVLRKWL